MTNLIGMALVVLATNSVTLFETNQVWISCESAGCTNWSWVEVATQPGPGLVCTTGKVRSCIFMHAEDVVVPTARRDRVVVGVEGIPLFTVVRQVLIGKSSYTIFYKGPWIEWGD